MSRSTDSKLTSEHCLRAAQLTVLIATGETLTQDHWHCYSSKLNLRLPIPIKIIDLMCVCVRVRACVPSCGSMFMRACVITYKLYLLYYLC